MIIIDKFELTMNSKQIRICMFYEFKLNQSAPESTRYIMQAFDEENVTEHTIQCWYVRFSSGDFRLEDKLHGVRSTALDDEVLKEQIKSVPSKTVRELVMIFKDQLKTIANHLHFFCKVFQYVP